MLGIVREKELKWPYLIPTKQISVPKILYIDYGEPW